MKESLQRLIHIEIKIDTLMRLTAPNEYKGSPDQRYGHISYSQHGEDFVIVSLFEFLGISNPSFLDIGANDPWECSNTALLYKRGSRGVNIDASPDVIRAFDRERPEDKNVNIGAAKQTGTLDFYSFGATSGRNTFSRKVADDFSESQHGSMPYTVLPVAFKTLDSIIDEFYGGNFPDFLSLDAEGLDFEILESVIDLLRVERRFGASGTRMR